MFSFLLLTLIIGAFSSCPKIDVQENFNITEYTRATWYIQYQQITKYLPLNSMYCTIATYAAQKKSVPFFGGQVVSVDNYDNLEKVNGENGNSGNQTLCARVPDSKASAKLLVAPCFLPNFAAGDYWIIAAGPTSLRYDWAIVSGGQPTEEYPDGCTTSEDSVNGSGFWFFTRQPVGANSTIEAMFKIAQDKGYTLQRLHKVIQTGCTYNEAIIKPDLY